MKKKIHFHIGPHKTGSSALQGFLSRNEATLARRLGIGIVVGEDIRNITKDFEKRQFVEAEHGLSALRDEILKDPCHTCIVSSEDLSGGLPGRSSARKPYAQLWRNLSIIEKVFQDFDRRYYFFIREPEEWLQSAYRQNVVFRQKFTDFSKYRAFVKHEEIWDGIVGRSQQKLGDRFVQIPFSKEPGKTTIEGFCRCVQIPSNLISSSDKEISVNVGPQSDEVHVFELINGSSASRTAKRAAKLVLQKDISSRPELEAPPQKAKNDGRDHTHAAPPWPPSTVAGVGIPSELTKLWTRVESRIHTQNQPDLMTDEATNFAALRTKRVVFEEDFPSGSREDMHIQFKKLQFRFSNYPEAAFHLALCISYLRRDTLHTQKARALFHKLWNEEHELLLGVLPTRWLLSSFQTFWEHGKNEQQRVLGSSAFFFGNLLKIYEAERGLEGLPANSIYPLLEPGTKNGFPGLDRFSLGGSDVMLNTIAHLLQLVPTDATAGRVLQEFLLRLKAADTVFSRMDNSRISHGVSQPQFIDCWSFFEKPQS